MPGPKWDGKLHKPMKFGEGMKPGTVEWERDKRRRRERQQIIRQMIAEREHNGTIRPTKEPHSYAGWHWVLWRVIAKLFRR